MTNIRQEKSEDATAIWKLNEKAFGQPQEADIVDKIRAECANILSLVALRENMVVGHIFFSPAVIESVSGEVEGMGLAPVAVLPEYQRQGIGSELIRQGLDVLQKRGCPFVIVLGHPDYYPRFGFELASLYGLKSQWQNVPDEAFMVMFFNDALKQNISGIARYRDEFDEAM
jgi:putative acetyltransferase